MTAAFMSGRENSHTSYIPPSSSPPPGAYNLLAGKREGGVSAPFKSGSKKGLFLPLKKEPKPKLKLSYIL